MNCEDFKTLLLQQPHNQDEAFHQHRRSCSACETAYQQAMQFEKQLIDALNTPTPPELPTRLLQEARTRQQQRKKRAWLKYSLAASLLLVISSAVYLFQVVQIQSLPKFVLAHIEHEVNQLDNRLQVNAGRLARLSADFDGGYLQTLKQKITYVEKCWLRTGYGLHLIVEGQTGPVTLLLMPNEATTQTVAVRSERFTGNIYPLARGSFALVGEHGESIEMLAESLRMAMQRSSS
ncbi:MAG: DUF3379 family protein [Chromatiales bacterium]